MKLFFEQERVGQNESPLWIKKIQTMRGRPNRTAKQIAERFSGAPTEIERTTLIGSILRLTGLDELPQLMNVVTGEIQWIGMRPLPKEEYGLLPPDVAEIYNKHKPGLFDVTLVPRGSNGSLKDKLDRMRATKEILDKLDRLEQEKRTAKRAILISRLSLIIYMRKITDEAHIGVIRAKLKNL